MTDKVLENRGILTASPRYLGCVEAWAAAQLAGSSAGPATPPSTPSGSCATNPELRINAAKTAVQANCLHSSFSDTVLVIGQEGNLYMGTSNNKLTELFLGFMFCVSSSPTFASHVGIEPWTPSVNDALVIKDLLPWISDLKRKISANPIAETFATKLSSDTLITCTMLVKENGEIKSLRVRDSSGIDSLDHEALNLVTTTAPFRKPPNYLPCTSGTSIFFEKKDGQLRINARPNITVGCIK